MTAPDTDPDGTKTASRAQHRGDVDDDKPAVLATLARVPNGPLPAGAKGGASIEFKAAGRRRRAIRRRIDRARDGSLAR